jgi:2-polyprenyl-3-methyl-5-hydroxy-6-metoxy-1,4-benzoquinol methylase
MNKNSQTNPTVKKTACNLCGTDNADVLFDGIDRLHGFEGQFTYVKCKQCGLVYMNPQLTVEELKNFYPDDYAPHSINNKQHKSKLPLPNKILQKITDQTKVLDVGCGNGGFLARLKKITNCKIFGLDISENAVKAARKLYNIDIFCGTIFDAPYQNESFDIITAHHYIEHVNDPLSVLKKMYTLLKPNGQLILKTPNIDSFNARIFKDKWYPLDCPRHLFLFSPQTLAKMLKKTGFTITTYNHEKHAKYFLLSLQYLRYGNNYEEKTKNLIRKSRPAKIVGKIAAKISQIMRKSDNIIVYAHK